MAPLPGRAVGKTVHLAAMLSEIRGHVLSGAPTTEKVNVLVDGFASILPELSPYGKRPRGLGALPRHGDDVMMRDDLGGAPASAGPERPPVKMKTGGSAAWVPFLADRIRVEDAPPGYDPCGRLEPSLLMPYRDPFFMRRFVRRPPSTPFPTWRGGAEQVLKYAEALDVRGRLRVWPLPEVQYYWTFSQLMATYKDATRDRALQDRRGASGEEAEPDGPVEDMLTGDLFVDLRLEEHEVLWVSKRDTVQMYPSFIVSPARSWSSPLGRSFWGWELGEVGRRWN